ncbi:Aste57867_18873 [Aphanomyces stellatus]|uniref:Aste57867_18873 protein n=1 Tax=Aphanomyces stellatus TaxID=120398 RepID=A0A485LCY1_9STRA|nr:hypothetical protein As57867_018809 [Aphanomyces stellatus]VFT95607.1 Aste57867_18873 [Aphanomyces stellatus]
MFPAPEVGQDFLEFRVYFDEALSQDDADVRLGPMKNEVDLFLDGYVWQKEPLILTTMAASKKPLGFVLGGKMLCGDNVEDEWVATAALLMLTRAHADITVQVWDADGEFLLIEAADALPPWLHPDNSANRVFLRQGHVHIVHQNKSENRMNLKTALDLVMEPTCGTRASAALDALVLERLTHAQTSSMKRGINCHVVQCILPRDAAVVFQAHPHAVAYAVEAFYYREPTESTHICRHMKRFPPTEMVPTMVTLTRCMYAQTKQQQFAPPKPFQTAAWPPRAADDAMDIGMKLACGLELLYHSRVPDVHNVAWRERMDLVLSDERRRALVDVPLRPSDDDAWLYVTPEGLEAMLHQAETTLKEEMPAADGAAADDDGGQELQNMATLFNKFVSDASDYEGVAKDHETHADGVSFDLDTLMAILKGGGGSQAVDMPAPIDEEDDYFFESDDESDEGDDMDGEMESMMAEMDAELATSKLAKSFHRAATDGPEDDAALKPVDIDFNLVSNLLESFASQEGSAGPVSNMLRDMGFAN